MTFVLRKYWKTATGVTKNLVIAAIYSKNEREAIRTFQECYPKMGIDNDGYAWSAMAEYQIEPEQKHA